MVKRVLLPATIVFAAGCGAPVAITGPAGPAATEGGVGQAPPPRYATQAQAYDPPSIVPVGERYHGKSYEDLSAAWWNWAFNQPIDGHPILDTTGEDAANGQHGDVWFLGGAFRGIPGTDIPTTGPIRITRHVVIPAGKALFFPILNSEADNSDCGGTSFVFPFAEASAFVTSRQDQAYGLSASIDGVAVPDIETDYRVDAGPFTMIYGPNDEENITSAFCGGPGYRGTYKEAASAGYWLLLRPLDAGHHTIHFTGALPGANPFVLDITYQLHVVAPGASGD